MYTNFKQDRQTQSTFYYKIDELKVLIKSNRNEIIAIAEVFPKVNDNIEYDSPLLCILGYSLCQPTLKTFTNWGCM